MNICVLILYYLPSVVVSTGEHWQLEIAVCQMKMKISV